MNKKHWNTVEIENGIPPAEILKMIDHSYNLVASAIRKTQRAGSPHRRQRPAATITRGSRPRRSRVAKPRGRR
jgi:hypothetical protein